MLAGLSSAAFGSVASVPNSWSLVYQLTVLVALGRYSGGAIGQELAASYAERQASLKTEISKEFRQVASPLRTIAALPSAWSSNLKLVIFAAIRCCRSIRMGWRSVCSTALSCRQRSVRTSPRRWTSKFQFCFYCRMAIRKASARPNGSQFPIHRSPFAFRVGNGFREMGLKICQTLSAPSPIWAISWAGWSEASPDH